MHGCVLPAHYDAGDRGAVEAGCLPTLLPGGRPIVDAQARVDAAAAWGTGSLPDTAGRDGDAIVAALANGDLGGLVIGGVDPDDTSDPVATRGPVLTLVDSEDPPLRVFFGEATLAIAKADYEQRLATWEQWQPLAVEAHGGTEG